MHRKRMGAAALAVAFVAGLVVATALGGGMAAAGRRARGSRLPCTVRCKTRVIASAAPLPDPLVSPSTPVTPRLPASPIP